MEPINIFSRCIDPRGVLAVLRSLDPEVRVIGPDDDWQEATITVRRRGGETLALTFRHDSEYYDGPDWPDQLRAMRRFVALFPDMQRKADVVRLISTLRFMLETAWEPELDSDDDERLDVLFAVAEHLDGMLFTLSSLWDSQGRILIASDGESDPDAVFPQMPDPVEPAALDDSDFDDEEEYEDPEPPTPPEVARRALALTAVTARALAEQCDPSEEGIEDCRQDILKWLAALGINDEPEPDEWKVLQRPVGQLDRQDTVNATWRLEGLGVLAWALGRLELPPHDVLVDPRELFGAMGFLDEQQAKQLRDEPKLRPPKELAELQKQLLGVHWRLRDFTLRPEAMDFREFSKNCWFGSFDLGPIRLIDDDLALGDFAIADAPEEVFAPAHSAAMERHQAINWLHWGGIYSETDTST